MEELLARHDVGPVTQRSNDLAARTAQSVGSASARRRRAAVVSSDRFDRSDLSTVVVATITSSTRLAGVPDDVVLPSGLLPKESVVDVIRRHCVDRAQTEEEIADLSFLEERQVDDGLRLVLGP